MATRVAARRHDASDATPDVVRGQLQQNIGAQSAAWISLEASGSREEALQQARAALALDGG
jgi:hypothetical protein